MQQSQLAEISLFSLVGLAATMYATATLWYNYMKEIPGSLRQCTVTYVVGSANERQGMQTLGLHSQ